MDKPSPGCSLAEASIPTRATITASGISGAKRMVMLEGVAGKRGILVGDAKGWQSVEVNQLHPRHQCCWLAWDADLGGLLLHGGEAHHEGP
jgi:hypothetical protein